MIIFIDKILLNIDNDHCPWRITILSNNKSLSINNKILKINHELDIVSVCIKFIHFKSNVHNE